MATHMKTTLNISEATWKELKREAARRGETMSELVEAALRLFLREPEPKKFLPPLPSFNSGGALVDVSNRESLYDAME
ncbi:MAG TPA: ribbon-helix-helix protein, CopG family [Rhodothermales bacterium]|nr:ribbon-helix-helix protein, CopG family [Rhodothermales bacterium]